MSTLIVNGTSFDTPIAIGNAWTDYFETLSKASDSGTFDGIYKSLVETDLQNLRKYIWKFKIYSKVYYSREGQQNLGDYAKL